MNKPALYRAVRTLWPHLLVWIARAYDGLFDGLRGALALRWLVGVGV